MGKRQDNRGRKQKAKNPNAPHEPEVEQPTKRMTTEEAFEKVRQRANRGDPVARGAMVRFLKANPWLFKKFGDLADRAENAIIEEATGGEWFVTQAVRHEAHEMRKSLAGPNPSVLEVMSVDRIIAAWLLLQHVQMQAIQPQRERAWATFWMRKLESAEKMYRSALASLALVRQFLPASQPAIAQAEARPSPNVPTGNGHLNGFPEDSQVPHVNGVNRIAHLAAGSGDPVPEDPVEGLVSSTPRVNGFHHRLTEFLAPASPGTG